MLTKEEAKLLLYKMVDDIMDGNLLDIIQRPISINEETWELNIRFTPHELNKEYVYELERKFLV